MLAVLDVVERLNALRISCIHIKLRGQGGTRSKQPGQGGAAAVRALARKGNPPTD
jgi:small subunit ribosomal protein S14e